MALLWNIPTKDVATPIATVTASLIAAFIGSLWGAKTALARFKQERGFERRLNCYEEISKRLGQAKLQLEIAQTFQDDPNEPRDKKLRMWKNVQQEYIALSITEHTALIYASNDVYANLVNVRGAFDEVSDQTNGMDVQDLERNSAPAYPLLDVLAEAIQAHANSVRHELGFETLEAATAVEEADTQEEPS